jgi:hypothetical protein
MPLRFVPGRGCFATLSTVARHVHFLTSEYLFGGPGEVWDRHFFCRKHACTAVGSRHTPPLRVSAAKNHRTIGSLVRGTEGVVLTMLRRCVC